MERFMRGHWQYRQEGDFGTMSADMEWFQLELALANWHLDAALSAAAEAVQYHRDKAQQSYSRAVAALTSATLSEDQRAEVERRIHAVRSRLEPAPDTH